MKMSRDRSNILLNYTQNFREDAKLLSIFPFFLFIGLKIGRSINVNTNNSNNGKLITNEGLI